MMRPRTIGLFLGISVRVHPSLALMCILVALLASSGERYANPDWNHPLSLYLGLAGVLIYCASLLLHELGHVLALRHFGIGVESVVLNVWGGRTRMAGKVPDLLEDGVVAAAGPAVTLFLAAIGSVSFLILRRGGSIWGQGLAQSLAILNLALLPGCLLPVWPTDSYRVVRAIVWRLCGNPFTATRLACNLSLAVVAVLLELGALCLLVRVDGSLTPGYIVIGTGAMFLVPTRQVVRELRTAKVGARAIRAG